AKTFESMGVDPKMVEQRIALMSDEEVSKISSQIDTLPAGGDFGGIIGAVVFVFVVLLITDILGFTKVFGFTRSVR
ncbi:MAG: PA2779 family protein, partial [Sulfuricurvum sp.]|uniref:PA2779 family protein n=1 Tax=Sulfuricurvum sp. TaxID=2025608 RepID=UPI0026116ACA